uniref:Protochlorophyllide reductase n=1 Tax=Pyrodinium bahamense TaxID=73915 RepID=A0A7S0ACP9_9DINO
MAARDTEKLKRLAKDLGERAKVLRVDLSDLATVKEAARELLEQTQRLDYLVNNAGTYHHPYARTKQGFEWQFGVNHLGSFLFTQLLTPLLIKSAPSRVIMTSSALHYSTGAGKQRTIAYIDWEDWNWQSRKFDIELAFTQSMLANVMWAREYANHYAQNGITAVSVHPGCVATNAQRHRVGQGCWSECVKLALKYAIRMIDVWPGSQTTLHAILADSVVTHNGDHYAQAFSPSLPFGQPVYETREQDSGGWPMEEPSSFARDPANLKRLWDLSQSAVKAFL